MAVDTVTQTQILGNTNGTLDTCAGYVLTWGPMANSDTGAPVSLPGYCDRSIQASGTFGSGGSVAFEGSNDGVNYYALPSPGGSTIAITTAAIDPCTTAVLWIRPHVTAGDGTTSLTVTAYCRNQQQRF
jgi:cystathionine beta-lyase family protein involved in aluminum resistance